MLLVGCCLHFVVVCCCVFDVACCLVLLLAVCVRCLSLFVVGRVLCVMYCLFRFDIRCVLCCGFVRCLLFDALCLWFVPWIFMLMFRVCCFNVAACRLLLFFGLVV